MLRLFIAIDLTVEARLTLAQIMRGFAEIRGVRWVRPETLHLTLRFLGDTAPEHVPELALALAEVCGHHPTFELRLGAGGAFPRRGPPRVLWVGLEGDLDALRALNEAIDQAVGALGYTAADHDFHPHITLGRVKAGRPTEVATALAALEPGPALPVTEVVLFESDLQSDGARHTPLARAKLRD